MLVASPLYEPKGYCGVLTEETLQSLVDEEGRVNITDQKLLKLILF